MKVHALKSAVSDNFFYIIEADGEAALVDPIDAEQARRFLGDHRLEPVWLVNTHFHHDHIGGNRAMLDAYPDLELVTGAGDSAQIAEQYEVSRRLSGGDRLRLGGQSIEVLETPGHTPGHISLMAEGHLLSGDTIFVGGAGNCNFGGDVGELFKTFRDVLTKLDGQVRFYPGHDYAARNIEFILSVEPDNSGARAMLDRARAVGPGELMTTTLGEERGYSPFMRFDDPALRESLQRRHPQVLKAQEEQSTSREEAVFRAVRELRNRW